MALSFGGDYHTLEWSGGEMQYIGPSSNVLRLAPVATLRDLLVLLKSLGVAYTIPAISENPAELSDR